MAYQDHILALRVTSTASTRGGSRGGSLGSNEPPFLPTYSTHWFLLLLPACLTLSACVPVLFSYCIISVQPRASISRSVYWVNTFNLKLASAIGVACGMDIAMRCVRSAGAIVGVELPAVRGTAGSSTQHRDIVADLDFDKLVVHFANKHPRRMALPCVFSD